MSMECSRVVVAPTPYQPCPLPAHGLSFLVQIFADIIERLDYSLAPCRNLLPVSHR